MDRTQLEILSDIVATEMEARLGKDNSKVRRIAAFRAKEDDNGK
jgi:hypothetical protein